MMSNTVLIENNERLINENDDFDRISEHGLWVSEADYWEHYYEHPDFKYEWVNGFLEEVGVSNYKNVKMYRWFLLLLEQYLQTRKVGQLVIWEFGFRLDLGDKISIRIPDLALVRADNLVLIDDYDNRYKGVFDLCVELISNSSYRDIKRDTEDKVYDYQAVGVKEYYILDADDRYMAFYRRNPFGRFEPIEPIEGDIICSEVLPGFHFRRSDLFTQPSLEAILEDNLYNGFVVPAYTRQKKMVEMERQRAEEEKRNAEMERQKAERLAAKLR
jgi:Uma2 family endonuclease